MADEVLRVKLSAEGQAELVAALRSIEQAAVKTGKQVEQSFKGTLFGKFQQSLSGVASVLSKLPGPAGAAASAVTGLEGALAGSTTAATAMTGATGALSLAMAPLAAVVLAVVAAFAAFGAAMLISRQAAQTADSLENMRQKLGATAETTAFLAGVMQESGADIEGMSAAVGKLSKGIVDLRAGASGDTTKALKELGLSAKDFANKDLVESMTLVGAAIAKVEDPAKRAQLALDTLGKQGLNLVPTFNAINEGGLEPFRANVERLFSAQAVKNVDQFGDLMDRIGFTLQGLGIQFADAFGTEVLDALKEFTSIIDEDMIAAIRDVASLIGTFGAEIIRGFTAAIKLAVQLERVLSPVLFIVAKLTQGFFFMGRVIAQFAGGAIKKGLDSLTLALGGELAKAPDKVAAALKPEAAGSTEAADQEAAAAQRARRRQRASDALAAQQQQLDAETQALEAHYRQGLISLEDYYAQRKDIADRGTEAELTELRVQLETVDPAKLKSAADLESLNAKIALKLAERTAKQLQLDEQRRVALLSAGREIQDLETKGDESREAAHAREMARIAEEEAADRVRLAQLGVDQAKAAQLAADARERAEARQQFGELATDAQSILSDIDGRSAAIRERVSAGLLASIEGESQILELEQQRVAELTRLAELMRVTATFLNDAQLLAQADALDAQIASMNVALEAQTNVVAKLGATFKDALTNELANFLSDGIAQAESFTEAIQAMASAVVSAIQRMLSEMLAAQAIKALFSFFPFGGGGAAGKRDGGLMGFPGGGRVSGRGGSREDRIPALLSHGEYVVQAAAVRRPGMLGMLEGINRGAITPALRSLGGIVRLAGGGMVSSASADGAPARHETSLVVGLEQGLVVREIQTPEAERAIVRVVAKNRRSVSSALGG